MPTISRLKTFIDTLRQAGVSSTLTQHAIEFDEGTFVSNRGTSPSCSPNAKFGRFMSLHQQELKIRYAGTLRVRDANDHPTRSAVWQILPVPKFDGLLVEKEEKVA